MTDTSMRPESTIDLDHLQRQLADVDIQRAISAMAKSGVHPYMVLKREHLKIRVYKEANHQRPHFHIEYKNKEFTASYGINPLRRLAGKMPARYEKPMLAWAASNQATLLKIWNGLQSDRAGWEVSISERRGWDDDESN
jgi:hypothetical protein